MPGRMTTSSSSLAFTLLVLLAPLASAAEPVVKKLWPGEPPGPSAVISGDEADTQKPTDRLVGGKTVMKVGNVSSPEIHVYLPAPEKANGSAVIVCPGGGYNILAWDLEGTEVAQWLNDIGVAAVICKYRVPTGSHGAPGKWQGPVSDAQRAISITRQQAAEWKINPDQIGVLGFSAGGDTAARTALNCGKREYEPLDETDKTSCAANFAILVYPAYLVDKEGKLNADVKVTPESPPTFCVHAANDPVTCLSSIALCSALKANKVPTELHIFASGGHGYGLRPVDEFPVTKWPRLAENWLKGRGMLGK